uniref:Uncharacterized protein n=1 Tax=Timema genevievae TaxID=629358 RepID=A0A7R9PR62_TIMGE|nr:unnamed protein product [Timema genevievae]
MLQFSVVLIGSLLLLDLSYHYVKQRGSFMCLQFSLVLIESLLLLDLSYHYVKLRGSFMWLQFRVVLIESLLLLDLFYHYVKLRGSFMWLQFSLVFIGSLLLLELSHHFVWFPLERIPYVRMKQFASLLHYNSYRTTGDLAGWVAAHAPLFSYLMSATFLGFILYAHRLVGPGFTFPKISSFFIPRAHSKSSREPVGASTCRREDIHASPPYSNKRPAYRSKSMLERVSNRPSTLRSSRC